MNGDTFKIGRHIFTIGHSNHPLEWFLGLLKAHGIEVLVDVRSHPYSKHAPHFDHQMLKARATAEGIRYLFLGAELGGRPKGEEFYDADGHVLYWRVAESAAFLEGISRLEAGIQKYKVAIMCSEENPAVCHRRLLIGRVLVMRGIRVCHIRGDGRVQTDTELAGEEQGNDGKDHQLMLFNDKGIDTWKSIRSVLQRGKRPTSSEL
ncbi:MAG TPA: DUF488 domain-containing protein [Alphaproteobacteria bacterium]|nr:DUF488 domain-containing protein [Alphaproteobacteria bacterium]